MSKIFDGLKRATGELADLTIRTIGDAAAPDVAPKGPARHDGVLKERSSHREANGAPPSPTLEFPVQEPTGDHVSADPRLAGTSSSTVELPPGAASEPTESGPVEHDPPLAAGPENSHAPDQASGGPGSTAIRLRSGSPLFPFDTGEAVRASEEYRRIRTKILQHHKQPRLMLISSPGPGDGKSVTAINIGAALALNPDARVLLVDTDLRRPQMARLLGVPEADGLAEVLAGSRQFPDVVVRLEPFPNLFLLAAGQDRANATELLSSYRWKALCDDFRSQMTYTILDGPPVDAVAEYSLLQEPADGLILVVRTDHTVRSLLNTAVESIPKQKLLGAVVNSHRESFFWKRRGGYYS